MEKIKSRLQVSDTIIPGTFWDVTKSGKVLELRVRPSIDQKPEKYRLGVIQIGRIISRIQSLAEISHSAPQIQLFPNLAESQLVATVFCPDLLEDLPEKAIKNFTGSTISIADIEQLAAHYNLYTDKTTREQSAPGTEHVLRIVSHSNQPFIWLKVGQFIQDLTVWVSSDKDKAAISIEVDRTNEPERSSSERSPTYPQVTLSVP